ncbi:hypothetical protein VP01_210g10 [Puccinia sorghi]|uniref:Uncharacterized protein n=1 Tax=Puccinia sorghi TaxID=27349 RepID=A0A0L6VA07_9BASI|nr:hypothetical protein VP01_210g10 [Puccinia sorghi]
MGEKLSITKVLLPTPLLSNNLVSPMNALAHKYLPLALVGNAEEAITITIILDFPAISALFGSPIDYSNITELYSSILPAISMIPTRSDAPSSDDSISFEGSPNLKVLKLLKEKKKECAELKEASQEATRRRWSLEKQLDQKARELTLALQTSESRYVDCIRMDGRLHDLQGLESKLESALSEIRHLKKSLADSDRAAQLREEAFEAEKLSWSEERERLQFRISSLADSLKHAQRCTPTEILANDLSPSPGQNSPVLPDNSPSLPEIPPEIEKELCELRELVPAYVETLDTMEFTIQNLNVELDELQQAYTDAVAKSYGQQELIEQLNQQLAEVEKPRLQESLAAEMSHASSKRPSTSSSEGQTKLLKLRRLNDSTKSTEIEDLRTTNARLNDYLERLLNRIIGLEAFEHVLNLDFEAIREGQSRQAVVFQAPSTRARRTVSSSLANKTLRQLKAAKSRFLDKLNHSASSGVQLLAKPFATNKNINDHLINLAKLMPRTTSGIGSVEYGSSLGR